MKGLRQPMGSLGQLLSGQEQEGVPWAQETSRPCKVSQKGLSRRSNYSHGELCFLYTWCSSVFSRVDGYDINNMRINYYF